MHGGFCESRGVKLPPATHLVLLVKGSREQAEALRDEIGTLLAEQLHMTLSTDKTLVTHIDDGYDFLVASTSSGSNEAMAVTWYSPGRPRTRWRR